MKFFSGKHNTIWAQFFSLGTVFLLKRRGVRRELPVEVGRDASDDLGADVVAAQDLLDDVAAPEIINQVPDIAPLPQERCHEDCRCCVPACPCSKNRSNVPVMQAKCICKCHKKI
ncbi:hypothetical protein JTE90_028730 [Oedothorax gibbosus]|uniref:Uncharacterized protein n=1 Tax=Oedothorax gibbosus TaxID=931172 RepID=A0AAV6UGU4_9ARAC|nr:hypothetical protein JTE90_028730 [Oedothorax gibbosus]